MDLNQTVEFGGIQVRAFYAGHVLGAAMFHVSYRGQSVVYTGDYNTQADRHLGAAAISRCRPDVLITETTYARTIRDSKRARERDFLKSIHDTVKEGGKVLVPVFALGRAQELCILIETYWERMGLGHVPVYFSAGLTERANYFYQLFISWTNQKIKNTFVRRNMFDFQSIKPFDRSLIDSPGPMVVFATPGMLNAGTSLELFKRWCGNKRNSVIIPGYCVAGTVGNKILSGRTSVEIDGKMHRVECSVRSLSFSAHADARGIMHIIRQAQPRNVVLVHGEKGKMAFLKERIAELGINCADPANGESVLLPSPATVAARADPDLLDDAVASEAAAREAAGGEQAMLAPISAVPVSNALLIVDSANRVMLTSAAEPEAAARRGPLAHLLHRHDQHHDSHSHHHHSHQDDPDEADDEDRHDDRMEEPDDGVYSDAWVASQVRTLLGTHAVTMACPVRLRDSLVGASTAETAAKLAAAFSLRAVAAPPPPQPVAKKLMGKVDEEQNPWLLSGNGVAITLREASRALVEWDAPQENQAQEMIDALEK